MPVWGAGTSVWVPVTPAGVTQIVADAIAILAPDTAPGDSELMTLKQALDEGEGVLVLDGMDETSPLEIAEFVDELHAMTTSARILGDVDLAHRLPSCLHTPRRPAPVARAGRPPRRAGGGPVREQADQCRQRPRPAAARCGGAAAAQASAGLLPRC